MNKEQQVRLETIAIMLGIGGYKGSSQTLQERCRQVYNKLVMLERKEINANQFAVTMLDSIEFCRNQM